MIWSCAVWEGLFSSAQDKGIVFNDGCVAGPCISSDYDTGPFISFVP